MQYLFRWKEAGVGAELPVMGECESKKNKNARHKLDQCGKGVLQRLHGGRRSGGAEAWVEPEVEGTGAARWPGG
ncbi:unnamed protein product [Victoria cruziana]